MRAYLAILFLSLTPGVVLANSITLNDVTRCLRAYVSNFDGTTGAPSDRMRVMARNLPLAEVVMVTEPLSGACANLGPGQVEASMTKTGVTLFELSVAGKAPRFLHLIPSDDQMRLHQQLQRGSVGLVQFQLFPQPSLPIYLRVIYENNVIREEFFWGARHVAD